MTRRAPHAAKCCSIEDVLEILATPLLGIIPESQDVLRASNVGSPVTLNNAASAPARAYIDAVRRLMGETVTMMVPVERKGFDEPVIGTEGRMISLLRLISGRNASAPVARERLQILLAHERGLRGQPELLELLRAEILAVVSRHVVLDPEKVVVRMERGNRYRRSRSISKCPTTSKGHWRLPVDGRDLSGRRQPRRHKSERRRPLGCRHAARLGSRRPWPVPGGRGDPDARADANRPRHHRPDAPGAGGAADASDRGAARGTQDPALRRQALRRGCRRRQAPPSSRSRRSR